MSAPIPTIALAALALAACGGADGDRGDATSSATPTTGATSMSTSTSGDDTTTDGSDASTATSATTSPEPEPPSIARVGDTFVIPTLATATPKRFADVAHDPNADIWLQVNGNVATSGTFLSGDAAPLGEPFAIAELAYTQGSRVAFGGSGFLVAWHDNRVVPETARLFARRVVYAGGPQLGVEVEIGTGDTYSEMPPAIAWSQTSAVFLVAWHTLVADDIHAQRVDIDGNRVGEPIVVTADPDWQSDVGIAWNPERDEWLVVYTHAGATTEVRGQVVAADGTLVGTPATYATAAGTWLAQAAFDEGAGEYLVAWFDGSMGARTVGQDGAPSGEPFGIASGYGSYDGFAIAYDASTGWFGAVFHGTTDEDFAIAFDATGVRSEVIEATASQGTDGHFNPRIAARGDGEWLLVTSRGFADVVGQRLGR